MIRSADEIIYKYTFVFGIYVRYQKNDSVALVEKPTTTRTSLLAVDS